MQALVPMHIFKTNIYHVYDANFRVSISDISSSDRPHIFVIASLSQGLIFFSGGLWCPRQTMVESVQLRRYEK